MDKTAQLQSLFLGERTENYIVALAGIGTLGIHIGGTLAQLVDDKITNHILVFADEHNRFSQHDVFNNRIYHEGFHHKTYK